MRTILIVEDQSDFALLVTEFLKPGHEVVHFSSLEAAVDDLPRVGPDLVLLDLHVPPYTGMSALRKFMENTPSMPVVVLTGLRHEGLKEECLLLGADELLQKDKVNRATLAEAIRCAQARENYRLQRNPQEAILARLDSMQTVVVAMAHEAADFHSEGVVWFSQLRDLLEDGEATVDLPMLPASTEEEPADEETYVGPRPGPLVASPPQPPEVDDEEPSRSPVVEALRTLWNAVPGWSRPILALLVLSGLIATGYAVVNLALTRLGGEPIDPTQPLPQLAQPEDEDPP